MPYDAPECPRSPLTPAIAPEPLAAMLLETIRQQSTDLYTQAECLHAVMRLAFADCEAEADKQRRACPPGEWREYHAELQSEIEDMLLAVDAAALRPADWLWDDARDRAEAARAEGWA